jgi:hypothetical protein
MLTIRPEVELHDAPPVLESGLLEVDRRIRTGVVDQDVQPAEVLGGLADGQRDRHRIGDAGGQPQELPTGRLDALCRQGEVRDVEPDDRMTMRGKSDAELLPESLRRAGHDGDPPRPPVRVRSSHCRSVREPPG